MPRVGEQAVGKLDSFAWGFSTIGQLHCTGNFESVVGLIRIKRRFPGSDINKGGGGPMRTITGIFTGGDDEV